LADIGKAGKKAKNLTQQKEPSALPPLTSGLVNAGKALAGGGAAAADGEAGANSNNPKAKSLISIENPTDHDDKVKEAV